MTYREVEDAHKENLRTVLNDIFEKGITEVVFGRQISVPLKLFTVLNNGLGIYLFKKYLQD
ncbi:hypothetical protein D3C86_1632940 [compost metagenome]